MNDDNFASIDRLVEFGLGMAVAKQMTSAMNHAVEITRFPGPTDSPKRYHAIVGEKTAGPFTEAELSRLISEGTVDNSTYIWRPGMVAWQRVEDYPEVLQLATLATPPVNRGDTK